FDGDAHIGRLLDELRNSWCWDDELSFVAVHDDELVGQVLYTQAWLDDPERLEPVLVLSPVGVRPDLQRQGVGSRLIRESLATLAERPDWLVFLEGSPAYYPRLGFRPAVDLGFEKPSVRIPDAAFQVTSLRAGGAAVTGRLIYPDAFWRTDSVGLREP
ncbi:MAG: N-acetyltransferase, partial [Actinomycetota bacterium]